MARHPRNAACALALILLQAGAALATPPSKNEDDSFKKRFATLEKTASVIQVQMGPKDDPGKVPEADMGSGPVLVAGERMGLFVPPILDPTDMLAIINQNMKDVRRCYKVQLDEDPEWADDMILDLAVKKTGRVSEVEVSPRRVRSSAIGECLMSTVPKWRFPEFTGETDEGIVQEVVNASFPLSFSTK